MSISTYIVYKQYRKKIDQLQAEILKAEQVNRDREKELIEERRKSKYWSYNL
jgi:hypothetical protein